VYGSVVERFAKNTEPALLERVGWALIGKAESLDQLDQFGDAETVFRQAIGLDIRGLEAEIWNRLGNLLLDRKGDWNSALATYEAGLAAIKASDRKAFLHANCAYVLALHGDDFLGAHKQVELALADGTSISPSGRHLLEAISCLRDSTSARWFQVFEKIGEAVTCEDPHLWDNYFDDLQRLLWFVISQGEVETFRRWMEEAKYPLQYAPFYHAIMAVLEGEDHLLQINPETRQPANLIYEGIARRIRLYGQEK